MDFLNLLRLNGIFNPQTPSGNDLPSQGGITGNMPRVDLSPDAQNPDIGFQQPSPNVKNVFSAPSVQSAPSASTGDTNDIASLIRQNYNPDTEMGDYYKNVLYNEPTRNEHVGMGKKILGVLASIGGTPHTYEQVTQGPYLREHADWQNRLKEILPAMQDESRDNSIQRQLATGIATSTVNQKKEEDRARENEQKIKIAEDRAEVYRWKNTHPDWVPVKSKGGTVKFINPKDPTQTYDTGIDSGVLPDAEKMALQQENELQKIGARTQGQIQVEGVKQGGRVQLEKMREANPNWKYMVSKGGNIYAFNPKNPNEQIDTGVASGTLSDQDKLELGIEGKKEVETHKATLNTDKGNTPQQAAVAQAQKAREILARHPELRPYVTIAKDRVNVEPRNRWLNNPELYDQVVKAIYGDQAPTNANTAARNNTNTPPPVKMPTSTGKAPDGEALVTVINPKGQKVQIRQSQYQDAITTKGYKAVQ